MSQGAGVGEVVHCDEIQLGRSHGLGRAKHVAADSAEAVDAYFDGH
jgi:hypothetical protein